MDAVLNGLTLVKIGWNRFKNIFFKPLSYAFIALEGDILASGEIIYQSEQLYVFPFFVSVIEK